MTNIFPPNFYDDCSLISTPRGQAHVIVNVRKAVFVGIELKDLDQRYMV